MRIDDMRRKDDPNAVVSEKESLILKHREEMKAAKPGERSALAKKFKDDVKKLREKYRAKKGGSVDT